MVIINKDTQNKKCYEAATQLLTIFTNYYQLYRYNVFTSSSVCSWMLKGQYHEIFKDVFLS